MKKVLFCMLMMKNSLLFAGHYDTIYVNDLKNSYLVFDEDISIVDIGTAGDFASRIEKNVVFIKAIDVKAKETTLFVAAGNRVFAGVLTYRENNTRYLYDLRERTINAAASYSHENYVPEIDINLVRERLFSLQKEPRKFFDIGVHNNKLFWILENLRTDYSVIYLKMKLENNSALVYRVESITVENAEFYKKRFLSRKKINKIPVQPIIEGNIADVKPYGSRYFYLAIPVYAVGEKGAVLVTIRETTGVRSLQLEIDADIINSADLF